VTNCLFGTGHGVSIGSYTSSGVSNLTVINCTFTNTDNGIRMKSDNTRGGVVQNLSRFNLNMSNVQMPFVIYSYYDNAYSPNTITTAQAASTNAATVVSTTPIWGNVIISNVTAVGASGYLAGTIWARVEISATNFVFSHVNVTASKSFNVFSGCGIQFVDSQINVPSGVKTFNLYNSQLVVSNSASSANPVTLDGLTTNGFGNGLALYNTQAYLSNTNALGNALVTRSGSTLTVSNNLQMTASSAVSFTLGTNTAKFVVTSNLFVSGTINITAGAGFTNGCYILFTYGRKLTWGPPTLGSMPAGCSYAFDTNTTGQVNLLVSSSPPVITKQPASQVVLAGSDVLFTVGVAGSIPLSCQWWFNSTDRLAAGTNISLTISNAQPTNAGSYSVVVTNALGAAVSSNARLAILESEAWGDNTWNQLDVPAQALDVIAIAAGAWHNLALRADGRVLAWGNDSSGQCDVPAMLPGALAIAGGGYHSLALRADGTVVAWGANDYAQTNVPAGLANVIGISAGTWHSVALCRDGTVAAWGDNSWGQSSVPAGLSNVVAIAAGGNHSLALQTNGMVVAWGENTDAGGNYIGQSRVPANLADVVAIGAGEYHSLAVRSDRTVVAWGDNSAGQGIVPVGLSNVVAVAGGGAHSVALTADGAVAAWGDNWNGQCNLPTGLSDVVGIGAGENHSVALLAGTLPVPQLLSPARQGKGFGVLVQTLNRKNYALEFKSPITATNWSAVTTNTGNGALRQLGDPAAPPSVRFYRAVYLP
jgi:alpha-tubulin suppressor-like RCC1 family protein